MASYSSIIRLLNLLEENEDLINAGDFSLQFSDGGFVTLDFIEVDKCQSFLDILNSEDTTDFIIDVNYRSDVSHLVSLELDTEGY